MELYKLIEKLMEPWDGCPCECNIPCPYYNPSLEDYYCKEGDCCKGMEKLIREIIKNNG